MLRYRSVLEVLAFVVVSQAQADDAPWNRFRGPDGAGTSGATTVPVKWTDKDYNWKITLPGPGHSSPVVWSNKLFLTCSEPASGKRMVLCLDTADGRTLWQRDYPSKTFSQHRDNSYATATPAADANGVVVAWTTPAEVTLLALDPEGRDLWRRDLGPFVAMHGSGSSPIILDDLAVLANDQEDPNVIPGVKLSKPAPPGKSFLIAVDRKTGQTRWQIERRTAIGPYSTPCVYRPQEGPPELIFANTSHGITAVDPATGKVTWSLENVFRDRSIGSPVAGPGLIIAADGWGGRGTHCVAVRPGSQAKGVQASVAYEIKQCVAFVPTPLVKNGRLFHWTEDGIVSCLNATNGDLLWRERVGGSYYGSPVWVNGRLYCTAKNGEVVVVAAGDKGEVLARVPLGEPTFSTPAVSGGVMYLRTLTHLFSLGGKKS